jgi:phosphoenolpyruvate-protein kinase (PTS system EI component)
MNIMALPRVKRILRSLQYKESKSITDDVFKLSTAQEIEKLLKKTANKTFPQQY